MFLCKKISKTKFNQTYCSFQKVLKCRRQLSLKPNHSEKGNKNSNNLETLLEEYESRVLYNSVIESSHIKFGYKQNNIHMAKKLRFEEKVQTTLRTIQPLPLSLKYIETESSEENMTPVQSGAKDQLLDSQSSAHFPYKVNTEVDDVEIKNIEENNYYTVEKEIDSRRKLLKADIDNWMTNYENYEYDLVQNDNKNNITHDCNDWKINYGTPDPDSNFSNFPCGGCGAHLHCKDTAIPGYIPSEIFNNCFKRDGADLGTVICQRCHFLKEYDIALQVRVSHDDYPNVLKAVSLKPALVVLMVDLTDFPCSIWPGIADILGAKTPIIVVGNKIDLIPRDELRFSKRVKQVLLDNVKLCGFARANIKDVVLISAKTGFGVENLVTSLQQVWKYKGDVYLVGCTNVGKSSLFNALLQSDFCKIQAADLIQRATTSRWPGTTLNLLKFPITRISGYRLYLRMKRLHKLNSVENEEERLQAECIKEHNSAKHATLIGHIGRSLDTSTTKSTSDSVDCFSLQGSSDSSGKTKMGIDERHPDYITSKWCFDTPGVVHSDQILHMLTTEELVQVLPKQLIRAETFCVKPGTTLFIAGLARLDYVNGPNSIRLTVFRSNKLPVTVCKTDEADSLYKSLLGTELLGVPIGKGDRLTKWTGLRLAKSFTVVGRSDKESSKDVVLSNAGWIAINCGLRKYQFQAWTPEKRGVYVRDSLLPKCVSLRGARIRESVAYKKNRFL